MQSSLRDGCRVRATVPRMHGYVEMSYVVVTVATDIGYLVRML